MATYSIVLAWRIPGTGEPGGPLTDLIVLAVLFLVILPLLDSKVLEGRIIYLRHQ